MYLHHAIVPCDCQIWETVPFCPPGHASDPKHLLLTPAYSTAATGMDNPNQSPRNEYVPISEERRQILEEKYRRRNLAPEALIIKPRFRQLHVATIVLAVGKGAFFMLGKHFFYLGRVLDDNVYLGYSPLSFRELLTKLLMGPHCTCRS